MPVTQIPPAVVAPAPSGIKSIQRGIITFAAYVNTTTATVAAVNTAKAELRMLGFKASEDNVIGAVLISLTNGTTITADRNAAGPGANAAVSWELTEWY